MRFNDNPVVLTYWILIVRDVKPENVLALAKEYFGSIRSLPVPNLKPETEISSLGTKLIYVQLFAKLLMVMIGISYLLLNDN